MKKKSLTRRKKHIIFFKKSLLGFAGSSGFQVDLIGLMVFSEPIAILILNETYPVKILGLGLICRVSSNNYDVRWESTFFFNLFFLTVLFFKILN